MKDHPLQPIETDASGLVRFKRNRLVEILLLAHGQNELIAKYGNTPGFREDYDQLLQLIGYTVSGAPLSDVTRARVEIAEQCPGEGEENNFSMGYANGKADALQSAHDAIAALGDD